MIRFLGNVALGFAVTGCATFVITYAMLANWRRTALGRNVMAFMVALCGMLSLAVLRNFTSVVDDNINWVRLVVLSIVAAIVWQRVYLLVAAQMSTRGKRRYGEMSTYTDREGTHDV